MGPPGLASRSRYDHRMRVSARQSRVVPSLTAYIERRLGREHGAMFRNWVVRTWGAPSFAAIWQYWNPVYGYMLGYYVYWPLRRWLPRPVAVWCTFAACGFALHDLPGWLMSRRPHFPVMTVLLLVFGIGVLISDATHMNLARAPFAVRVLANVAYVLASLAVARLLLAWMR